MLNRRSLAADGEPRTQLSGLRSAQQVAFWAIAENYSGWFRTLRTRAAEDQGSEPISNLKAGTQSEIGWQIPSDDGTGQRRMDFELESREVAIGDPWVAGETRQTIQTADGFRT